MKFIYTVLEVKPRIFLVNFKNHYDLCMTFLRYQEFYESPSPNFRGKSFTILEYMKWYSNKYGKGLFTYPKDWGGFNFPSTVIENLYSKGIKDSNEYDIEMKKIYDQGKSKYPNENFYIIGVVGKSTTLKHEIAHGFFAIDKNYKKDMLKLVSSLPEEIRKNFCTILKEMGYTPKVYKDEIQAYMSTGLTAKMNFAKLYTKNFIKTYNKHYKCLKQN